MRPCSQYSRNCADLCGNGCCGFAISEIDFKSYFCPEIAEYLSVKKLAGQTIWYGLSSIAARFINYLLTPYLTFKFLEWQYGEMSIVYAFIPFMNVIYTYGIETAFFRFANKEDKATVYNNTSISLIF